MSLTILEERLLKFAWEKAQVSLSQIFQDTHLTVEVYNLYVESISFRGFNSKNTEFSEITTPNRVKIWAILKNETPGQPVPGAIVQSVNRGLVKYEEEFLNYWKELSLKFKLNLDFVSFVISGPRQGIECYMLGKETKALLFEQDLGSGKFPESYDNLRSIIRAELGLLTVGAVVPILKEYVKTSSPMNDVRLAAIKAKCNGNLEVLIEDLKKISKRKIPSV